MAGAPFNLGDEHRTTINRYVDAEGNEIDRTSYDEHESLGPDGSTITRDIENRVLIDGQVWNPTHATRQENPVDVGVCGSCGQLASSPNLITCARCGSPRCPRHRKLCGDGEWRCPPCTWIHRFGAFAKFLFFKEDK